MSLEFTELYYRPDEVSYLQRARRYFEEIAGEHALYIALDTPLVESWKIMWRAIARSFGATPRAAEILIDRHIWPKYGPERIAQDSAARIVAEIEAAVRA